MTLIPLALNTPSSLRHTSSTTTSLRPPENVEFHPGASSLRTTASMMTSPATRKWRVPSRSFEPPKSDLQHRRRQMTSPLRPRKPTTTPYDFTQQ
ncbi:hypothetical protein LINPERPRIM_LOCUS27862 [Linum perenne]